MYTENVFEKKTQKDVAIAISLVALANNGRVG
jgi:hypothetical protein